MKTVIIAEAGVNHNGDLALARKLIDVAAEAGADFVKFQTFKADCLVTACAKKADYQTKTTDAQESQYEMLRKLELTADMHQELISHCKARGIQFSSTGFDIESINLLAELGSTFFKIPSGEITNLPYLRHIGRFGKPVILSTGMATLEEIGAAFKVLEQAGTMRNQITLLHCNTEYPTPMEDVNLRAIKTLRETFGVAVGYSDHTLGIEVAIAAVALGATTIEKHFTLDRNLPGPDHKASLEPNELKAMVAAIRNIEKALGDGVKRPSPSEIKNRDIARKSLVAACVIRAGDLFCEEKLAVKRPGTGISPMRWDEVIGCKAQRDFAPDELISL
ncbi:MAG: N-acetylneuraminate synthase [Deltaproteobacteria bacterium CG_4_10_14_0_2_um_filter_43_8]|nr:MAG: N-acetylneuraminate synthase [Deltaproteobacteria bacterium CG11_big_fil_rev_8_21_14_0_20_42_23]PJA18671.1 MAG: N-acetylneuraminate synthase [Deltaproteobacteria bacterium CG_4_10_14_0_2_um_filter_43_8]PJC64542.1 MAG: N-acetylneuraminate synthase [Deltaproteobacteria bacterium CG_4_9_14_0_2_um_filter_42_21]